MALYPFCRLTDTANVLIMPAIHSASISTNLLSQIGGVTMIGPLLVGLEKIGADRAARCQDERNLQCCAGRGAVTGKSMAGTTDFIENLWEKDILPTLTEYIRIPNKSPAFDPDWEAHGHMDKAVALFEGWAREKIAKLPGATLEVVRLPKRTPLIFIDVPGEKKDTVLLYGHLDKQPEMKGWADGTGPWIPVVKDDKLFGRGGADDGYAMFAALSALLALREQDVAHAHCVIVIEACEESGSYDLPFYIDHLSERIGTPSLVVCLDSGCGNYDQLWLTTSLRGIAMGNLTVRVLSEGVHSGDASGIEPSSFRIARHAALAHRG